MTCEIADKLKILRARAKIPKILFVLWNLNDLMPAKRYFILYIKFYNTESLYGLYENNVLIHITAYFLILLWSCHFGKKIHLSYIIKFDSMTYFCSIYLYMYCTPKNKEWIQNSDLQNSDCYKIATTTKQRLLQKYISIYST